MGNGMEWVWFLQGTWTLKIPFNNWFWPQQVGVDSLSSGLFEGSGFIVCLFFFGGGPQKTPPFLWL